MNKYIITLITFSLSLFSLYADENRCSELKDNIYTALNYDEIQIADFENLNELWNTKYKNEAIIIKFFEALLLNTENREIEDRQNDMANAIWTAKVIGKYNGGANSRTVIASILYAHHHGNSTRNGYSCIVDCLRSYPLDEEIEHLFGSRVLDVLNATCKKQTQIKDERIRYEVVDILSSFSQGRWLRAIRDTRRERNDTDDEELITITISYPHVKNTFLIPRSTRISDLKTDQYCPLGNGLPSDHYNLIYKGSVLESDAGLRLQDYDIKENGNINLVLIIPYMPGLYDDFHY